MSGTHEDHHNVPPSNPPPSSPVPIAGPPITAPAPAIISTSTAAANVATYQTKNRRIYFLVFTTLVILVLCAVTLVVLIVKGCIALVAVMWNMVVNMDTEGVVLRTIVGGAVVLLVSTKGRAWWGTKWSKGLQQLQHRIQLQSTKRRGFRETGSPLSPASLLSEDLFDNATQASALRSVDDDHDYVPTKTKSTKDDDDDISSATLPPRLSFFNPTALTINTTSSSTFKSQEDVDESLVTTTSTQPPASSSPSTHQDLGRRCSTCGKYVIDCECIACRLCSKPFAVAVFYRHHCRKCWVACCSTCRSQRRCINPFGGPVGLLRPSTAKVSTDVSPTTTVANADGDDGPEMFSPNASMNTHVMPSTLIMGDNDPQIAEDLTHGGDTTSTTAIHHLPVIPTTEDPFQPDVVGYSVEVAGGAECEVGVYFFKNRKQALEGAGEIEVMPLAGMRRAASYDHMETSIGSPNIMDHARRMFPSFPTVTASTTSPRSSFMTPQAAVSASTKSGTSSVVNGALLPLTPTKEGGTISGDVAAKQDMSPRLRGGKFIHKSMTSLDDEDTNKKNKTISSSSNGLFATFPSMLSTLMSVASGSYYTSLLDGDTHHKLEAAVITNIPKKPVCDGCANYPALGKVFLHTYDHISSPTRQRGLKILEEVVEMPGRCASNICNARTYQPTCPYCDLPTIDSQPFSSKAVVAQYGCRRCAMMKSTSSRCEKCKALDVALCEIERQCKASQDTNFRRLKVKDVLKVMNKGNSAATSTPSVLSNSESLLNTKRVSFSSTFPTSSASPSSATIRTSSNADPPSTSSFTNNHTSGKGESAIDFNDVEGNIGGDANHMDGAYTKGISLSERLMLASIGANIAYEYPSHPCTSLEHFTEPHKRLVRIVESSSHYTILEGPFRTLIVAFPGTHDIRTALTNVKGLQRQRIVEYTTLNGGVVASTENAHERGGIDSHQKQQPGYASSSPQAGDDQGVDFHRLVRTASQKKYVSGPVSRADMVEEYILAQRQSDTDRNTPPGRVSKNGVVDGKGGVQTSTANSPSPLNNTTDSVLNGGMIELWKYKVHKGYHNEEKHLREPEYLPTSRLRGFLRDGGDTDAFSLRGGMKKKQQEMEGAAGGENTTTTTTSDLVAGTSVSCDGIKSNCDRIEGGGYRRIIFTGHSLGGAMSMLVTLRCLAEDLAAFGGDRVSCLTFGAPFVGDSQLSRRVSMCGWNPYFHNIIFKMDVVPRLASFFGKKHLPAASIMFRNLIEDALGFNVSSAAQLLPSMLSRTVSNLSNNTSNGGGSLGGRSDNGRVLMGDRPAATSPSRSPGSRSRQRSKSKSRSGSESASRPHYHGDFREEVADVEDGAPTPEYPNGTHSVVSGAHIQNVELVESEESDEEEDEEEDGASEMSQDDNDVDDIAIQSWAQIVATVASKSPSSLVTRAKSGVFLGGGIKKGSGFPTSLSTGSLSMIAKEFLDGAATKMESMRGVSTAVDAIRSVGNVDADEDDDDMGSSTTTILSSATTTMTHTYEEEYSGGVGVASPTSSAGGARSVGGGVGDFNPMASNNNVSNDVIVPDVGMKLSTSLLQLHEEEKVEIQTPRRRKKHDAADDLKSAGESQSGARQVVGCGGGHVRRSTSAGHNRFSTTNETAIRNQLAFPPKGARRAYNPIGTYHFLNFRQGHYYQRYQATDCPENVVKLLRWGRPSKWRYHAHGSSTLGPPRMSFDDGHHIEATTDARFTVRDHLMHNYARAVWELIHFD